MAPAGAAPGVPKVARLIGQMREPECGISESRQGHEVDRPGFRAGKVVAGPVWAG